MSTTRTPFPNSSTCRRRHRSSKGPANGPTIVNGSRSTANAAATAPAVARFSGEKKNKVANPAWNMPSPHWETSRTANSLRNPECTATVRRSDHIFTWRRLSRPWAVAGRRASRAADRPRHAGPPGTRPPGLRTAGAQPATCDGAAHLLQVRGAVGVV